MLMERNEQLNYGGVVNKRKRVSKNNMKVKKLKNGKYVRMEARYRIARLVASIILVASIVGVGYMFKNQFVKVFSPIKYLETLQVESVATNEEENTYFDNFLSTLDVADEVDIRALRDYVMQINNMEKVNDYHGSYSLKVPVLNSENTQLVKE